MPTDRPIDGVDQTDVLFGKSETGNRDSLLTFIGADLVAARWKQWRMYFTDVHPTGIGPQRQPGMFSASAPMAGYPKVYNIEMDPHEDLHGRRAVRVDGRTHARGGREIQGNAQEVSESAREQPDEVLNRTKPFMKSRCRHLAGLMLLAFALAVRAEEGGVGHYAPGSFASFVDVLPGQPALGVFNYFAYYNGSANANRQFPIAGQVGLNVDATSYADSLGAFWVTPFKILGANYAPGVAIPFVWNEVSAQVTRPGVGVGTAERLGERARRHRVLAGGPQLDRVEHQPARGFPRRHLRAIGRIPGRTSWPIRGWATGPSSRPC